MHFIQGALREVVKITVFGRTNHNHNKTLATTGRGCQHPKTICQQFQKNFNNYNNVNVLTTTNQILLHIYNQKCYTSSF
jgi:hypothetical protein